MIPITLFNKTIAVRATSVLMLLLIAGAFIRFFGLEYSGLWLDEIFSMNGADPNTSLSAVYEYSKTDQPPLFFIILHGWLKLFGYTDFAGRSLTCLYGVLGILAIYFTGKEVKNEQLGLIVAFITTINSFHTGISQEIRFYPLVFLLTTLSYLFYLRSIKKGKLIDFLIYAFSTSCLLNTHYFGMVVFISQIIIFIIIIAFFKRDIKFVFLGIVSGGLSGLSLLHWLPVIFSDLEISQFHVAPVKFTILFDFAWSYIKDPVAFGVFAVGIFFAGKSFYESIKTKKILVEHVVIGGWIFFGFMIPLLYSLIKLPLLTHKYGTIIVPAFFLIIAYGLTCFKNENIRSYCLLTLTISGLIVLFIARPPYKPRRGEDWREVGSYFSKHQSKDTLVIFSQLDWFHQYYFKQHNLPSAVNQHFIDISPIVRKSNQVWLLQNDRYHWRSPDDFLPEQQEIIKNEFEVSDTVKFKQTKAILYTRKK